jgi:hypothetical protein
MRLPRLKMQQALVLVAVISIWLWLRKIGWIVLAVGTIVLTFHPGAPRHPRCLRKGERSQDFARIRRIEVLREKLCLARRDSTNL